MLGWFLNLILILKSISGRSRSNSDNFIYLCLHVHKLLFAILFKTLNKLFQLEQNTLNPFLVYNWLEYKCTE